MEGLACERGMDSTSTNRMGKHRCACAVVRACGHSFRTASNFSVEVNLHQQQGVRGSCWSVCNNVWLTTSFSQWKQILKLATWSKKRNCFLSLTQDWIFLFFGGQSWLNLFKYLVLCLDSVLSFSLRLHGYSLPGSPVHGILQARILEWVAMSPQGIFPTQGSNTGLPYCGQILSSWATRENLFSFWSNIYFYGLLFHTPPQKKKISFLNVLWFESC